MESKDLTQQQCAQLADQVNQLKGYLYNLTTRIAQCRFPPNDPPPLKANAAYVAVMTL